MMKNIKPSLKEPLNTTPVNEWLFGDRLDDLIKSAKVLESTSENLNSTSNFVSTELRNFRTHPRHQQAYKTIRNTEGILTDCVNY